VCAFWGLLLGLGPVQRIRFWGGIEEGKILDSNCLDMMRMMVNLAGVSSDSGGLGAWTLPASASMALAACVDPPV